MIRLIVPAELRFRDVAVRTVAAACKLVGASAPGSADGTYRLDLSNELEVHLVSAFSEAFNNIVIHAYGRRGDGEIEIEIEPLTDRVVLTLHDGGVTFDPAKVNAPELDSLPESGMGLFIIHSFADEFSYTPGPPNIWRLTKFSKATARQVGAVPVRQRLDQ